MFLALASSLFSTDGFPPRWQCGDGWTPLLGWTHILSDIGIWGAYMAIPGTMWFFARKRKDLHLPSVFWLYIAFILFCGFTHLIEAGIFYWPVYRLAGVVKFLTALVSLGTVFALVQIMPTALGVPGLSKINAELRDEIRRRAISDRRYRTLVQATSSLVWMTDARGQVVEPLPEWEQYTGQSYEQYQGEGWTNALHENDRQAVLDIWKRAVIKREAYVARGRVWSETHQAYRRFEASGVPVLDDRGEIIEWVGTTTDVEDREQLSAELAVANRDLERRNEQTRKFLNVVSHDLKSPVVTIQGFVGFMRNDLKAGKTDRLEHFLDRVDEASDVMKRSLTDLLQLSRVGFVRAQVEPVDLGAVVREVVESFEPQVLQRQATIEVEDVFPTVEMDGQHARQLFQNLIGNALKYGVDEQGVARVHLGCEQADGATVISVRDEGPGIPAEHHDRVFEVFERLQNTTKGTGVGLSIVRQIAENYGGTAIVESPPPGHPQGCRFVVRLPKGL